MKRQWALVLYAVRAAERHRARNLGVGIALALLVAMFSSLSFLADALREEARRLARTMPDLTLQAMVAGRPSLLPIEETEQAIRALDLPGLSRMRPRIWGYLYVPALEGNAVVLGANVAPRSGLEGRLPRGDDEVVIGRGIARMLGLRVGDRLALGAIGGEVEALRCTGVFAASTDSITHDVLLVSDARARTLLGVPSGMAVDFALELERPEEANAVSNAIASAIPRVRIVDRALSERLYALTFDARAGFSSALLLPALLGLLLLTWERFSGLAEHERREIGVLKACGWSTGDVLRVRMWEAIFVGWIGSISGVALGYGHAFVLGAPGFSDVLFGWSSLHSDLQLPPRVQVAECAAIVMTVLVPFVAMSVIPAWRAAILDPDRLLRGER